MARTIIDMPTALSNQEIESRLAMFFLNNGFQQAAYRGEPLYKVGSALVKYGYFKILYGNGMVHAEAFYVYKWREIALDDNWQIDTYDLRGKLTSLLAELGQAGGGFRQAMPQQAYGYQHPGMAAGRSLEGAPPDERQAENKAKRKKGCLIAVVIFLVLLAGCTALVMLYPSPQETDSPVARKAEVSMLAWKMLKEDAYSVRYPEEWKLTDVLIARTLSPEAAIGEVDLSFVYFEDSEFTYDELMQENIVGKILDQRYAGFGCDVFEKGEVNGKRAIFCIYTGELEDEKQTIYCYLTENGKDILFIYCIAENEAFLKYLPEIDTIVSSLKFK